MTPDELQAAAARIEAAQEDVRLLVAEVARLHQQTVELTGRALSAELEVQNLGRAWAAASKERDQWRLRWTRAQDQVGRWFKTQGQTQDELAMVDEAIADNLERHADTRDVVAVLWDAMEAVVAQCRYDCTRESNCGVCAIAFKALDAADRRSGCTNNFNRSQ